MKLRGATRLSNKLLASLGAAPVGMPVTQIPDAISKGVIEGALLPWEIVPAIKLNELAKSHSEFDAKFGAIYTSAFVMLMNKAKYDSLPADLKRVIDQSSGIDESARMGRVMQEADTPGRRSAESRGNKMFMIGAAESEAFRKASDQVDDDWIKEMTGKGFNGKQLYDAARTLIQKYSK